MLDVPDRPSHAGENCELTRAQRPESEERKVALELLLVPQLLEHGILGVVVPDALDILKLRALEALFVDDRHVVGDRGGGQRGLWRELWRGGISAHELEHGGWGQGAVSGDLRAICSHREKWLLHISIGMIREAGRVTTPY